MRPTWFQSSPGPKAGCYYATPAATSRYGKVSILTRPEGRVLPPYIMRPVHSLNRFQSSTGPKAGCYGWTAYEIASEIGFNPHPARRPGATCGCPLYWRRLTVSILTRPEGRVLPSMPSSLVRSAARFQSSPGPKAGCYRWGCALTALRLPFQSSPGPKAGCYMWLPAILA